MGFHIPDSPPRRASASVSASSQTTADADASVNPVQFSERFSSRRIVHRRNAIVPTLSIDVVGSPRSPSICLSRDNRFVLSQQHEQAQQSAFGASSSTDSNGDGNGDSSSSHRSSAAKRAPGIRRRSDQRDDDSAESLFASRASLSTRDAP